MKYLVSISSLGKITRRHIPIKFPMIGDIKFDNKTNQLLVYVGTQWLVIGGFNERMASSSPQSQSSSL